MGFKLVRECLDEIDNVFQKLHNNEELSREDEMTFNYFEYHLAEALMCEWRDCDRIAKIILDENKYKEIKRMFNQGIENPCYDYESPCPHRELSGSCNVVGCVNS